MGARRIVKLRNQGQTEFYEDSGNGTSKVVLKAAPALAGDLTLILPDVDGSAGDVLQTDGAGALSFAPASATPAAHATSHQDGGSDEVATDTPAASAIPKAAVTGLLDPGWLGSGSADATKYLRGDQAWADITDQIGRPLEYFRQAGAGTLADSRWYMGGPPGAGMTTTTYQNDDLLFAVPFASLRGGTIDRMRVMGAIAGGVSSKIRLGIYSAVSETDPYPGDLVVDFGEIAGNATGWIEISGSQTLPANTLLWLVYFATGGGGTVPAIYQMTTPVSAGVFGFPTATLTSYYARDWVTHAQAYGALPDPFPFSAPSLASSVQVLAPAIQMRYSA